MCPGLTRSSSNWSMPTINRLIKKWYGSPFLSGGNDMSTATPTSTTITARTQFLHAKNETYAYRRFGHGAGFPSYAFSDLKNITQPTLVVNGVHDEMIPVSNSYALGEHLPNAVLLTYPDSGNGSLFQFHESFVTQALLFLDTETV